jgi:hypothetical protein
MHELRLLIFLKKSGPSVRFKLLFENFLMWYVFNKVQVFFKITFGKYVFQNGVHPSTFLRFDVFTAVKKIQVVFWVVVFCSVALQYQCSGGPYFVLLLFCVIDFWGM